MFVITEGRTNHVIVFSSFYFHMFLDKTIVLYLQSLKTFMDHSHILLFPLINKSSHKYIDTCVIIVHVSIAYTINNYSFY